MLKIRSLQIKLTLIVGSILILVGIVLTSGSIYNANNKFGEIEGASILGMSVTPSQVVPDDAAINVVDITPMKEEFAYSSILYLVIIVAVGIFISYIAVKRALRPMKELNSTIQHMDEHHLSTRVTEDQRGDEVSQLARAFNHMLERLEKVFQLQKNFASSAAHELKTPIAVMKASLQVLGLDQNPRLEDYKETVDILEQEVQKLHVILEDLFHLTAGEDIEFNEEIDLHNVLSEIRKRLEKVGKLDDVELTINVEKVNLYGSLNLVCTALFNLVENAMKYNRIHGRVWIFTVVDDCLEIHVKDEGVGISEEALKLIFEPFYREPKSSKFDQKGVGLGLSIVKSIIDKHGWELTVTSEPGVGSEFVVKIPGRDFIVR